MKYSVEIVQAWFSYDPETGVLTRKLKGSANALDILNPKRHRVDLLGVRYQVTHIIWVVYYGKWPDEMIDHIDHNRQNNRISNLREATRAQNGWNRIQQNPNGKGVTFRSDRNQWQAQIQANNEKMHLGFFPTKEGASEAYRIASMELHGEFTCLK